MSVAQERANYIYNTQCPRQINGRFLVNTEERIIKKERKERKEVKERRVRAKVE
jgi:hypothetical protein